MVAQEVEEETCILDSYIDQQTDAHQKPLETAITEAGYPLQVTQQVSLNAVAAICLLRMFPHKRTARALILTSIWAAQNVIGGCRRVDRRQIPLKRLLSLTITDRREWGTYFDRTAADN